MVHVHHLIAENTVEDHIGELLRHKRAIADRPLNEAVRVGLAKLEERAGAASEVSQTRPLPPGRRLAGGIDNLAEVLAIAEGEDYR